MALANLPVKVSPLMEFAETLPYSELTSLSAKIKAFNNQFVKRIADADITAFIDAVNHERSAGEHTHRECFRYIEIKEGISTLGAVVIIARIRENDIGLIVRCIEATHPTPKMYVIAEHKGGRKFLVVGGRSTTTYKSPRGYTKAELNIIEQALTNALAPYRDKLLSITN